MRMSKQRLVRIKILQTYVYLACYYEFFIRISYYRYEPLLDYCEPLLLFLQLSSLSDIV